MANSKETTSKKVSDRHADMIAQIVFVSMVTAFGLVVPLWVANGIRRCVERSDVSTHSNLSPEEVKYEQEISIALKDPVFINKLIAQLNDTPLTQELLADPKVMVNMRKVANAIEGRLEGQVKEPLDATLNKLQQKQAFLKDVAPKKDWAKKAIEKSAEQRTAERD